MVLKTIANLLVLLIWNLCPVCPEYSPDKGLSRHTINASFESGNFNGFPSIFSPRMDFDQWKPLTGRGDPLRNDPTYDYEPPVLERVHYWADDTRIEKEKQPERKSEVLMLGVSSRKPSIPPRSPMQTRRHPRPPQIPSKYEDFSYKLGDHYSMTILVPPPLPPPGHKPILFTIPNHNMPLPTPTTPKYMETTIFTKLSSPGMDLITSYAVQEANLIYQASTQQDWRNEYNKTIDLPNRAVSSDYAGWGPTTPFDDDTINETHNIIPHVDYNIENEKTLFYSPILHKFSTNPKPIPTSVISPVFLPTNLPPTSENLTQEMLPNQEITVEVSTVSQNEYETITTEKILTPPIQVSTMTIPKAKPNVFDMLGPMMSMPMTTDSDRPVDSIYAHASENIHVFREPTDNNNLKLAIMQTMQPPSPVNVVESTTPLYDELRNVKSDMNNLINEKYSSQTHDPYLHMRFTTPLPTTDLTDKNKATEKQAVPTYLIIQGHSKVKTYGSKPKAGQSSISNALPNPNETNEVKHLHPIKDKYHKNNEVKNNNRVSRAKDLKSVINSGLGSIEIQEVDVGIKYDVSDGSKVPIEIYRKGIVDSDENNYVPLKKSNKEKRTRRQADIENLLPFDEDTLEEYVYDFLKKRRNDTGIIGLLAKAITNKKVSSVFDDLEDDDNENDTDR